MSDPSTESTLRTSAQIRDEKRAASGDPTEGFEMGSPWIDRLLDWLWRTKRNETLIDDGLPGEAWTYAVPDADGRPPGYWEERSVDDPAYSEAILLGALEAIAARGCETFTTGPGSCLRKTSGRRIGATYGAEQACAACIAYAALVGTGISKGAKGSPVTGFDLLAAVEVLKSRGPWPTLADHPSLTDEESSVLKSWWERDADEMTVKREPSSAARHPRNLAAEAAARRFAEREWRDRAHDMERERDVLQARHDHLLATVQRLAFNNHCPLVPSCGKHEHDACVMEFCRRAATTDRALA